MKRLLCIVCLLSFCLYSPAVFADDTADRLKQLEDTVRNQAKIIEELQKAIGSAKKNVSEQNNQAPQPINLDLQQQVQELNKKVEQVVETQKKEIPSISNPAIGLVGETIFGYRSKGKTDTGSDRPGGGDVFQRSVELIATAAVDPFAKAYVVINASADPVTGESALTVEEAALQTTSLPGNLTMKAGRFFGEFGRLSYIHDHELPFVNRPLVLDQYIGGESRTDGLQINWLAPVDHYISLTLGAGNQFGGDTPPNFTGDRRHGSNWNYWGRLSTYFDLTPNISIEPGISALWNPSTDAQWAPDPANPAFPVIDGNTLTQRERRLVGMDFALSWKPLRNNQFQTLTWGTEVLFSNNNYDITDPLGNALPNQSVSAYGLYSYLTYKFHRQWSAGIQYERMENALSKDAVTSAESANISWALTHWNQVRLQYTHTDNNAATGLTSDDALYLQWAWIIGSHSHGWQQR